MARGFVLLPFLIENGQLTIKNFGIPAGGIKI